MARVVTSPGPEILLQRELDGAPDFFRTQGFHGPNMDNLAAKRIRKTMTPRSARLMCLHPGSETQFLRWRNGSSELERSEPRLSFRKKWVPAPACRATPELLTLSPMGYLVAMSRVPY